MKRGRPPLPPERRRHVRLSIAVTEDVADAMFSYAQHERKPLSTIIASVLARFTERHAEQLTAHQIDSHDKTA